MVIAIRSLHSCNSPSTSSHDSKTPTETDSHKTYSMATDVAVETNTITPLRLSVQARMLAVLDMRIAEVQSFLKEDPECVPLQRKLEELIRIQQRRDRDKLVLQKLAQTDELSMLSSTRDNNHLGKLNLEGISPMMPLGQPPQIDVCFDIDANRILNVSALEKSAGKEDKITNDKGRLSQDHNECMVQEAEKYKQAKDDANNNRIKAKNGLKNYCYGLKSSIEGEVVKDTIPADDKGTLLAAIQETTSWLDGNQTAEKEEFEEKQKALEAIEMPILQKMAGSGGISGDMGGMPDMCGDIIFYSLMKTSVGSNGACPKGCSDIMDQDNVQQETNVSTNLCMVQLIANLLVHSLYSLCSLMFSHLAP
jgi:hypothetical protein